MSHCARNTACICIHVYVDRALTRALVYSFPFRFHGPTGIKRSGSPLVSVFDRLWRLNRERMAVPVVNKYVLDSSVANLVLDGELWERCPCALVPYKIELQAALFCVEGGREQRKIGDIVPHTQHLPRAISAYKWARGLQKAGNTNALFITPTVGNELMRAPQVSLL